MHIKIAERATAIAIKLFHFPWYKALYLTIIGNMLPLPFLLMFLESLLKVVNRTNADNNLSDWFLRRTRQRSGIAERYERIGLMLFVAIPIPWTSAWTGSLAASLFGIKFSRTLVSITYGGSYMWHHCCFSIPSWLGWSSHCGARPCYSTDNRSAENIVFTSVAMVNNIVHR